MVQQCTPHHFGPQAFQESVVTGLRHNERFFFFTIVRRQLNQPTNQHRACFLKCQVPLFPGLCLYLVTCNFNLVSFNYHFGVVRFTCPKMAYNSKRLTLEWNRFKFGLELGGGGGSCHMYMGYLWPFSVQGHFDVIRCTCLKIACNSKMAVRSDINDISDINWDSLKGVTCIWGTVDLFSYACVYAVELLSWRRRPSSVRRP